MDLAFNPKDANTFLSACPPASIGESKYGPSVHPPPYFSMEAHEKGVNYVDFHHGADKPYDHR